MRLRKSVEPVTALALENNLSEGIPVAAARRPNNRIEVPVIQVSRRSQYCSSWITCGVYVASRLRKQPSLLPDVARSNTLESEHKHALFFFPTGTDDPATTRRFTRRTMTAFFNVFVLQLAAYRTYLDGSAMTADVTAGRVLIATKNGF